MTGMHPIAMIPYVNMAPFQEMGPPPGCAFVNCLPRESIQALKEKRVWAAAVPVGGLAALGEDIRFAGRFGIAVKERVMSVLFFSDRPFEQFRRPLTIGLTGESASSVRLLYLLLGYQHGFEAVPYLVRQDRSANGYLVIGDRALRWAREYELNGAARGYPHVMDLAAQWHVFFQLPFVFARWVIHKEAPQSVKGALQNWLASFAARESDLIQQAAPKAAARLDLPLGYTLDYLKVIRRCLTEKDEAGQQRFQEELKTYGSGVLFETSKAADPVVLPKDGMR